jgi:hypothetical protein
MGGFSSGRHGRRTSRPYLEQTTTADIALLRDALAVAEDEGVVRVRLDYPFSAVFEEVRVTSRPQPFGGRRWYFTCPDCERRCTKLHRLPGSVFAGHFACRVCHGLSYRSQALSMMGRWEHKAGKLYRRAGTTGDADYHYRPNRMRWATFNRLIDDAEMYSNARALHGLQRFLQSVGY